MMHGLQRRLMMVAALASLAVGAGSGAQPTSRVIAGNGRSAMDCASLVVLAKGDSETSGLGGRVIQNNCGEPIEATWCYMDGECQRDSGNSWTIGPGRIYPVSRNKEIRWAACRGANTASFEKGSQGLRYICMAPEGKPQPQATPVPTGRTGAARAQQIWDRCRTRAEYIVQASAGTQNLEDLHRQIINDDWSDSQARYDEAVQKSGILKQGGGAMRAGEREFLICTWDTYIALYGRRSDAMTQRPPSPSPATAQALPRQNDATAVLKVYDDAKASGNYVEAVRLWRLQAGSGNIHAAKLLAELYRVGARGVAADAGEAARWAAIAQRGASTTGGSTTVARTPTKSPITRAPASVASRSGLDGQWVAVAPTRPELSAVALQISRLTIVSRDGGIMVTSDIPIASGFYGWQRQMVGGNQYKYDHPRGQSFYIANHPEPNLIRFMDGNNGADFRRVADLKK